MVYLRDNEKEIQMRLMLKLLQYTWSIIYTYRKNIMHVIMREIRTLNKNSVKRTCLSTCTARDVNSLIDEFEK